MRHPQLIVYESDGTIAAQIEQLAAENRWLLRESRQPEACINLARQARPSVVILKLERQFAAELALLARLGAEAPDCRVIAVSDAKLEGADARLNLSTLAYDLGARCVLFPPLERSVLEDAAVGLMQSAIRRAVESGGDEPNA